MIAYHSVSQFDDSPHEDEEGQDVSNIKCPIKLHRIPSKVVLDRNITVHVKFKKQADIIALGGLGYTGHGCRGLWDDMMKTIYINRYFSAEEQWSTFRHELIHAIIDIDNETVNSPEYKRKATLTTEEPPKAEEHHTVMDTSPQTP